MTTAYERAKARLDELESAFYAALGAADAYGKLLDELVAEEEVRPEPNPELVRRYRHQRRELGEVTAGMEAGPLEALLRLMDRVLMIKQTEEGKFV